MNKNKKTQRTQLRIYVLPEISALRMFYVRLFCFISSLFALVYISVGSDLDENKLCNSLADATSVLRVLSKWLFTFFVVNVKKHFTQTKC